MTGIRPIPDDDPLAAYRAKQGTADAGGVADDPLAAYRAAKNPAAPAHDIHAEYQSGRLAKRMARENANDREAVESEPGYGQRLSTHLLNAAQGIPGVERVEAAAGSLGSKLTDHPMSYDQSLGTLRGETGKIGGKTSLAEHLMGSIAVSPFLRGSVAAQGAELGAADQLASADDKSLSQRAFRTAAGAAGGAASGAVLSHVAAPIIQRGAQLLTRGMQRIAPNASATMADFLERTIGMGPTTAERQAREMLRGALENGGVDPATAAGSVDTVAPTTMMELGSRSVPALVRAGRNVPTSTAGQTTDRFLAERAAGTGKRIEGALADATGHSPTDTALPIEERIAKRAADAKPLYQQAEAHGEIQDPETVAEVQRLLKEPIFQRAWNRGQSLARIEGSAPKGAPPTGLDQSSFHQLTQTPLDEVEGDLFVPNQQDQIANPTVRQINRWKKGLDAEIESSARSENALSRDEARVVRQALNNVLDRVDAEVPAFQQARSVFRGHSELKDAAEAGAEHFSPSTPSGALERQLGSMSPGEREAYQANALNKLVERIRQAAANPNLPEAGRATNIVQRIMGTEDAGQRLGMLFPDEPTFQSFLKKMEDEALYPKTNQFLRNQSSTAAQLRESEVDPKAWMDLIFSPVSGHARRRLLMRGAEGALGKQQPMTAPQANEVGRQATATGQRLVGILRQMRADRDARELGRKRLTAAMRGTLIAGEQGVDEIDHHPDTAPR